MTDVVRTVVRVPEIQTVRVFTGWAPPAGGGGSGVALDAEQTWTAQQTFTEVKDTVYDIPDGVAFPINPNKGSVQTITLGASRTPTASSFESGQTVLFGINAGANSIDWSTVNPTWVKAGGSASAPTLAAAGYTWVLLWKVGGTMYAGEVGQP